MDSEKVYAITRAEPRDLAAIANLVNSAYRGDSSRLGWTTEADLLGGQRTDAGMLEQFIGNPSKAILVLRECVGEPIIACVALEKVTGPEPRPEGQGCYLGMMTVDPRRQAGGIGKHLLAGAEQFAREWGATWMTLGAIQLRESLLAWYERRGYRRTGELRPFTYDDPRAGVPLRDDLHFVMFERNLLTRRVN